MDTQFVNTNLDAIPDLESTLRLIDANLGTLQQRALDADFTDPSARMHFKEDVRWLRRFYDKAEELLL
jgi:hypothetical protein